MPVLGLGKTMAIQAKRCSGGIRRGAVEEINDAMHSRLIAVSLGLIPTGEKTRLKTKNDVECNSLPTPQIKT